MCLYIKNNELIPKIAEKDIIVYKTGIASKYGIFGLTWELFQPCYRLNFTYTKNHKQPKVRLNPIFYYTGCCKIEEGYHAWINVPNSNKDIGVFIIPKGTKYFLGNKEDIVAETMIYKGRYT